MSTTSAQRVANAIHRQFTSTACFIGLSGLVTLSLGAPPARALVLVDLAPTSPGVSSQIFPDFPTFSNSLFDDFTISESFDLTSLLIRGVEHGNPSFNQSLTAAIWTTPDLTGIPLYSFSGVESVPNLVFDLTGTRLLPGTYWLSARVTRPFNGGGQWFWLGSDAISGAPAAWQNPGDGFGFGSSVVFYPSTPLLARSLAFRLEGNPVQDVPGPLPALGAFAGFATSRRLKARIRNAKRLPSAESMK